MECFGRSSNSSNRCQNPLSPSVHTLISNKVPAEYKEHLFEAQSSSAKAEEQISYLSKACDTGCINRKSPGIHIRSRTDLGLFPRCTISPWISYNMSSNNVRVCPPLNTSYPNFQQLSMFLLPMTTRIPIERFLSSPPTQHLHGIRRPEASALHRSHST